MNQWHIIIITSVAILFLIIAIAGMVWIQITPNQIQTCASYEFWPAYFGVFVSIANAILLYVTLQSQKQGILNEKEKSIQQRLDTDFYNMLEAFRKITDEIKLYYYNTNSTQTVLHGRQFFSYATKEMKIIRESLQTKNYAGLYNARMAEENDMYIDDEYDRKKASNEIDAESWRKKKELEYQKDYRIQLTNTVYRIGAEDWERCQGNEITDTTCYPFFYNQWGAVYNHYIRFFTHLADYVCGIKDERFAAILQAQLSTQEISLIKLHAQIDNKLGIVLNEINILLKNDQI